MLTFRQSQNSAARRRWMFQLIGLRVTNETPTGATPGTSFALAYIPDPNTLVLTVNGQSLTGGGVDYTLSGQSLTMVNTVLANDVFIASYDVPALTGQTGKGYISKNGEAAVQTSNSMVEVDSTNMPGFYYIELTAGELDTAGFLGLRVKTAQSLNYEDKALITYDDPYAFHGGFPIGAGKVDSQKLNWKKILEMMKQAIKEELPPVEEKEKIKIPNYSRDLEEIKRTMQDMVDKDDEAHGEMAEVKDLIKMMKPKDYTKDFLAISKQIEATGKMYQAIDVPGFKQAVENFQNKFSKAAEDVAASTVGLAEIKKGFSDLQSAMEKFQETLNEQANMDKRFDSMMSAKNDQKLESLTASIKEMQRQLMTALVNYKFDILKSLVK